MSQAELYSYAKKRESNLDFDMWYPDIKDGYVWTNGKAITDQELDSLLKVNARPHWRRTDINKVIPFKAIYHRIRCCSGSFIVMFPINLA